MNMNQLTAWAGSWLQQLLFRRRPQDDVLSYAALALALGAYLLMDLLQAAGNWPPFQVVAVCLLDVAVMIAFTGTVLLLTRKITRLVQTLTALAGTGALLGIVGLPLFFNAAKGGEAVAPSGLIAMGWLVLFVWHISVQAHIYRHALTTRFSVGAALAVLQAAIMIALMETLFPHAVETGGF